MHVAAIKTKVGIFTAHFSEQGLAVLNFPDRPGKTTVELGGAPSAQAKKWLALTKSALDSILNGKSPAELPPFDLAAGTDFQRSVWDQMCRIPMGQTKSYGEIAEALRNPGATRAVGGACGANPIPVLIPCHRVLAAQGKLGGFSGGLDWKRKLLAFEGHSLREG
jgi:O-6-methylguanine DNA methyltransferase